MVTSLLEPVHMRVLVEQQRADITTWLSRLGSSDQPGEGKVSVRILMGGSDGVRHARWVDCPEEDAIRKRTSAS